MPSLRKGLNCGDACPLDTYQPPLGADEHEHANSQAARAVAYHAGFEGQPADNDALNDIAQGCAEMILANQCPLRVSGKKKAGLHFRSGPFMRHHRQTANN